MGAWAVLGLLAALPLSDVDAAGPENPFRVIVQRIDGLTVGMKSTDRDVVRLFGKGCFVDEEGHGGGRYFIDVRGRRTLHTEIGVDGMTEFLELIEGVNLPVACSERGRQQAYSRRLDEAPAMQRGIRMGMGEKALRAVLGPPDELKDEGGVRVLRYRADEEKDKRVTLFYEATYRFVTDRLVRVSLYDGD